MPTVCGSSISGRSPIRSSPPSRPPPLSASPSAPGRSRSSGSPRRSRRSDVLVILDNCEHVIDAAAALARSLVVAGARWFGSSRRAASRSACRTSTCTGCRHSTSPPRTTSTWTMCSRHGAVQLFTARAQAVARAYEVDRRSAPTAAAICRRLDGIPLAIELAAARVAALGIEGVAAKLDDRFRLLTGGQRTALARQQTLRATLDWSHELLSEPERVLFRRLSVLAGSFSLDAAARSQRTRGSPRVTSSKASRTSSPSRSSRSI